MNRRLMIAIAWMLFCLPAWSADITWHPTLITAANTARDGTGTVARVLTADEENAFLYKIVARAAGTNAATALRVFVNNGSDRSVASNNILIAEKTLAATTASETAALAEEEVLVGYWIPQGYQVYVTIGTAGTDGWFFSAISGSEYAALFTTP